jgi:hypothetical protein
MSVSRRHLITNGGGKARGRALNPQRGIVDADYLPGTRQHVWLADISAGVDAQFLMLHWPRPMPTTATP